MEKKERQNGGHLLPVLVVCMLLACAGLVFAIYTHRELSWLKTQISEHEKLIQTLQLGDNARDIQGSKDAVRIRRSTPDSCTCVGAPGKRGQRGKPGDTGAEGPRGSPGSRGPAGPQGFKGDRGDAGAAGTTGEPGPAGPRGLPGEQGALGMTGAPGEPGPVGPTGEPGLPGEQGTLGMTGAPGEPGPVGPPGSDGHPGSVIHESIHLVGNGQKSNSQRVTNWALRHREGSILYNPVTGHIEVKKPGYYFIYSQMYYYDGSSTYMGHATLINDEKVLGSIGSVINSKKFPDTKYHGGVFLLRENDTISVHISKRRDYYMTSKESFFGAFWLGRGAQVLSPPTTPPPPPPPITTTTSTASLNLTTPTEFVCQAAADVAFIVDSSGSISRRNWFKMLHFLKTMVKAFNVGPDKTHIAVVTYSTTAKVEFKFDRLTGSQVTVLEYSRLIDKIRHPRGFTYIDKGLILANREVFTREAGMRPELPQIAIVITDGRQTKYHPYTELGVASSGLKLKKVQVYSIGVGAKKRLDIQELEDIASSKEHVLFADSFDDLTSVAQTIIQDSCPDKKVTPQASVQSKN